MTRARADGPYQRGTGVSTLIVLLFEERLLNETHSFRYADLSRAVITLARAVTTVPGLTVRVAGHEGDVVLVEDRHRLQVRVTAVPLQS